MSSEEERSGAETIQIVAFVMSGSNTTSSSMGESSSDALAIMRNELNSLHDTFENESGTNEGSGFEFVVEFISASRESLASITTAYCDWNIRAQNTTIPYCTLIDLLGGLLQGFEVVGQMILSKHLLIRYSYGVKNTVSL